MAALKNFKANERVMWAVSVPLKDICKFTVDHVCSLHGHIRGVLFAIP